MTHEEYRKALLRLHTKNWIKRQIRRRFKRPISPGEMEDACNEVFVRAMEIPPETREKLDSVEAYVSRIIANLNVDEVKRLRRDRIMRQEFREHQPSTLAEASAHEELERRQRWEKVEAAIASLPPKCREVLLLRVRDVVPFAQIARDLSITQSTAKNHFNKAMKRIARAFEDAGSHLQKGDDHES